MSKLTPKQQRFIDEYLIDLNATQAAIRAGYSEKTAHSIGEENLKKPGIAQAVNSALEKRAKKTKIDAEWVINELQSMWNADISDIITSCGHVKPVQEWPPEWKKQLNGFEIAELWDRTEDTPMQVGDLKKLKWINRERIMEMTGKHVGVQAFQERKLVEHVDKTDMLAKARKRASESERPQVH